MLCGIKVEHVLYQLRNISNSNKSNMRGYVNFNNGLKWRNLLVRRVMWFASEHKYSHKTTK